MWQYAMITGILLAQSFSDLTGEVSIFPLGEMELQSVFRLVVSILLGIAMSTLACPRGIRDSVLLAHACACICGFVSDLSLALAIEKVLWWVSAPNGKEVMSSLLYMPGVALCSFCLEILLSDFASYETSAKVTGVWIGAVLASVWAYRIFPKRNIIQYRECAAGTRLRVLEITRTEAVTIISANEVEATSPLPKVAKQVEKVSSPIAETTPSDFSETRWVLDLTDEDEEEKIVSPDHWYYIDLSGSIQGPFSTKLMRTWYNSGLLRDDLRVSRKLAREESSYASIGNVRAQRRGRHPFE